MNHWPNDFRFFPIFLYYYLSLFLLQFSDHELLNVCLLSNSLLPPRHTAATPPVWDGCQLLPPAPPAAVGPSPHSAHGRAPHTARAGDKGPHSLWVQQRPFLWLHSNARALSHGTPVWDMGCTGRVCNECSWGSTHRHEGICPAPIPAVKNSVPIHGQGHGGDHCAALVVMAGQVGATGEPWCLQE